MKKFLPKLNLKNCIMALIGSAILAFGLYNIHSFAAVTEGGGLGLTLLLQYWFGISPSVTSLIMNVACYFLGWRTLGKEFIGYSVFAGGGFSLFYAIFESSFDPLFPVFAAHPLAAAVVGGLFVGVGVGLCVRAGGAPGGDDALAMSLSHKLRVDIRWVYLFNDLVVLALSLTYIPLRKILFSLVTVILSGQVVGWIQNVRIEDGKLRFQKSEK